MGKGGEDVPLAAFLLLSGVCGTKMLSAPPRSTRAEGKGSSLEHDSQHALSPTGPALLRWQRVQFLYVKLHDRHFIPKESFPKFGHSGVDCTSRVMV